MNQDLDIFNMANIGKSVIQHMADRYWANQTSVLIVCLDKLCWLSTMI